MLFTFDAFSQRGTGKPHNEDAALLDGQIHQGSVREHGVVDTTQPRYFAVADGVAIGTLPRLASRRLLELLMARLEGASETTSFPSILQQVQQDYVSIGDDPQYQGMASTLVGVRLVGTEVTIFNVGDSRAYLLTGGRGVAASAHLLSRDHSLLNDMLDDGEITPAQAASAASIMQGLTCQFIADAEFNEFKVNTATHTLQPGERILLCSDGLNEVLSDAVIAALLTGHAGKALLNACKASRRAGGTDDFTVIVLEGASSTDISG